jgi:hypothetical protein
LPDVENTPQIIDAKTKPNPKPTKKIVKKDPAPVPKKSTKVPVKEKILAPHTPKVIHKVDIQKGVDAVRKIAGKKKKKKVVNQVTESGQFLSDVQEIPGLEES